MAKIIFTGFKNRCPDITLGKKYKTFEEDGDTLFIDDAGDTNFAASEGGDGIFKVVEEGKLYGVLGYITDLSIDFICLDGSGADTGWGQVAVPMTKKAAKRQLELLKEQYPSNTYSLFKMKIKENK